MKIQGIKKEIIVQAGILWDYLRLGEPLRNADCLIAMGSHDLRVAEYAARLFLDRWAPILVCSGGFGRLTKGIWHETEAGKFAQIALNLGVPPNKIFLEEKSANTAENLRFSRDLLGENGLEINSAILVHKPYMERRVRATADIVWPKLDFVITSPPISFTEYPSIDIPLNDVIEIMVGDFHRLMVYADRGFQSQQSITEDAMRAFDFLVKAGFDGQCVKE